jgi:glutamate carboxypeptidase
MRSLELLERLRSSTDRMVEMLEAFVSAESPTEEVGATDSCARLVAEAGAGLLGREPEVLRSEERTHLRWRSGDHPRVLVLGHFDTVWPLGTIDRWPFSVDGHTATGPGIFDMKTGLVQGLFAVAALGRSDAIEILFNSDEEIGSPTSRRIIEEAARGVKAVLVLEPSFDGKLKVARKGASGYRVRIEGRAAHAGLEPDKGANALVELSHQVLALEKISRPPAGTTVTPTLSSSGTAPNTVPAAAEFYVDVRAVSADEQDRVDREIRVLRTYLDGTRIAVEGGIKVPPLPRSASDDLFPVAQRVAAELGAEPLEGVEVGGASDGNVAAAAGAPTLDGLGAVGDHAHAEGEYVVIPAMAERAALVAGIIDELLTTSG